MQKTLIYTTSNIQMIYNTLVNLKNQGNSTDFEIRLDDLKTVHRTNVLSKFYLYQKSLSQNTNEVIFILYKGKSRRSDKYILSRNRDKSPKPNMTTQEYIDEKVRKKLKKERQKRRIIQLEEKVKRQKKTIRYLETRREENESKNKIDIQSILKEVTRHFKPSLDNLKGNINGVPNEDIMNMILEYKKNLGEEKFGELLGIMFQIANYPQLIEELKKYIEEKINEYEDK